MVKLKRGVDWGLAFMALLPCSHEVEIKSAWIDNEGRFIGRLQCTSPDCRRIFEHVVFEGWTP